MGRQGVRRTVMRLNAPVREAMEVVMAVPERDSMVTLRACSEMRVGLAPMLVELGHNERGQTGGLRAWADRVGRGVKQSWPRPCGRRWRL